MSCFFLKNQKFFLTDQKNSDKSSPIPTSNDPNDQVQKDQVQSI